MKKIASVIILLVVAVSAYAQYATPALAERKGCTIKIDGEKLSHQEANLLMSNIDGEDYSAQWAKARGWRTAGISMIAGGGAIAAGGAMAVLIGALTSALGATVGAVAGATVGSIGATVGSIGGEEQAQQSASEAAQKGADAGKPIINGGIIAMGLGLATHIAGIPLTVVNSVKMSKLVDKYNESLPATMPETEPAPEMELSFGATRNGVGLCLTF
ncbi:MAG: hypothetical protein IK113_02985 [Bacteroidales bacterium]|nr:hypothetical protein [Bacteroidales bacterium]